MPKNMTEARRKEILFMKFDLHKEDEEVQVTAVVDGPVIVAKATVILHRSIKMAEYKYYKPGIELTASIREGYTVSQACEKLKELVRHELQLMIDEEKTMYKTAGDTLKLNQIIKSYAKGSTEYQLAYKELHGKAPDKEAGDTPI